MPPTLTTSLNPIDHPAFSPSPTAALPISHLERAFVATSDAVVSESAPLIPHKFFANQRFDGARTKPRRAKAFEGVKAGSINRAAHPTAGQRYGAPPKTLVPDFDLPDVPAWALGILAGAFAFLLVLAIVLFIAQFPPPLAWLRRIQRRWQAGYEKLNQDDQELSELSDGTSSAVAPDDRRLCGLKNRRPRLSIDTGVGVAYDAVGIVVPNHEDDDEDEGVPLQTMHSYDEEAFYAQSRSPATLKWHPLTAPLAAIPSFGNGRRSEAANDDQDEGASFPSHSAPAIATPDLFDFKSYHQQQHDNDADDYPGSALMKTVNGGIYHAADKLSRAFYDQVNAPEEGLLLPVHNDEREKPAMAGVFVD